jgi:hypothetical protein
MDRIPCSVHFRRLSIEWLFIMAPIQSTIYSWILTIVCTIAYIPTTGQSVTGCDGNALRNVTQDSLQIPVNNLSSVIRPCVYNLNTTSTNVSIVVPESQKLQVVYSNIGEQVGTCVACTACTLFAVLGHGSILVTVFKKASLREPNHYIIVGACLADLVMVLDSFSLFVPQFTIDRVSLTFCFTASCLGLGLLLGLCSHMGLMTCERYMYFCQPMIYDKWIVFYTFYKNV